MSALSSKRSRNNRIELWRYKQFTLASGKVAYQGGAACLDTATGKVVPAAAGTGLVWIGMFMEDVDATSAAKLVNVDLLHEVTLEWLDNDTDGTPISATTGILGPAYALDDHTVTAVPAANSFAGRVWAVDSVKGVAVERIGNGADPYLQNGATLSYSSNDAAPEAIVSGASYDVPTTAANSTITLPAAAPNGTIAYFAADGSKNGHTVQYRDATGPANITSALTASKRHLVVAVKRGGKWFANAYVSP